MEHKNKPIFLSQFHPEKYKIVKKNLKRETFQLTSQIIQIFKKLIVENNQLNQLSTDPLETQLLVYKHLNKDGQHLTSFYHQKSE